MTCLTAILNLLINSCFCDLEAAEHQQFLSLGTFQMHFQLKLLLAAMQDKLWLSVVDQKHQWTKHTSLQLVSLLNLYLSFFCGVRKRGCASHSHSVNGYDRGQVSAKSSGNYQAHSPTIK